MTTSFKTVFLTIAIISFIVFPAVSHAQDNSSFFEGPLVQCGRDTNGDGVVSGEEQCGFNDLIILVNTIIDFVIAVSIPIAAVGFMWAGFLYVTAAGSQGQIEKAHSIFKRIAIGFIIVLGAWLIVSTITSALLNPDFNVPIGI